MASNNNIILIEILHSSTDKTTKSCQIQHCKLSQINQSVTQVNTTNLKYSWDSDTVFIMSGLYATTMDLKWNKKDVFEVQTFSFNSRGWTRILYETFKNCNHLYTQFPLFQKNEHNKCTAWSMEAMDITRRWVSSFLMLFQSFTAAVFSCCLFVGLSVLSFVFSKWNSCSIWLRSDESTWLLLSSVWSINTSDPVPLEAIHAHAITLPPLCFTDDGVCFGSWAIPSLLHTSFFPSVWYRLILVSSVQRMLFQNWAGLYPRKV